MGCFTSVRHQLKHDSTAKTRVVSESAPVNSAVSDDAATSHAVTEIVQDDDAASNFPAQNLPTENAPQIEPNCQVDNEDRDGANFPPISSRLTAARVESASLPMGPRKDINDAPICILSGLKTNPELNRQLGVLCGFDAGRYRYRVRLLMEDRIVAVLPDKLKPLPTFRLQGISGLQASAVRFCHDSGRVEVAVDGLVNHIEIRPDHIELDIPSDDEVEDGCSEKDIPDVYPSPKPETWKQDVSHSVETPIMDLDSALGVLERFGMLHCQATPSSSSCVLETAARPPGNRRPYFLLPADEPRVIEACRTVEFFLHQETHTNVLVENTANILRARNSPETMLAIVAAMKYAKAAEEVPPRGKRRSPLSEVWDWDDELDDGSATTTRELTSFGDMELLLRVSLLRLAAC